jgi:hypothetical protein
MNQIMKDIYWVVEMTEALLIFYGKASVYLPGAGQTPDGTVERLGGVIAAFRPHSRPVSMPLQCGGQ